MDLGKLVMPLAAAAVGGGAAVLGAPFIAGKVANAADPKNWYVPGGVALVAGAGAVLYGMAKHSEFAEYAGIALAGVGIGFGVLGFQGSRLAAPKTATAGNLGAPNAELARRHAIQAKMHAAAGNLGASNAELARYHAAMGNLDIARHHAKIANAVSGNLSTIRG